MHIVLLPGSCYNSYSENHRSHTENHKKQVKIMRSNIVIVMADQQQAALRKAAGYCLDTMPNLDRFGQENIDLVNAYTPNPTCCPARTSMFTGRYASCHNVRTNHNVVDVAYDEDLLDVLEKAGYTTAICGKNHTYHDPQKDFDFCAESEHLGKEIGADSEPDSPLQAEFRAFLESTRFIDSAEPAPFPVECQLPYRNVSAALRFMDQVPEDKPFFTWVSFAEPHNPYQVPAPYYDMFPPESLPEQPSAKMDLSQKGPRFVWIKNVWDQILGDDPERIARDRSNYHGMLRLIDDQFGRLIDGLKERGLYDNTIVIYLSDHGDFVGEYGMMRKGTDLPEVLTHIPMLWHIPGFQAQGRNIKGFANIVDILPTLCDLIGVDVPFGVQGKSLVPLLKGEELPGEYDIAYSESGFGGLYWTDDDELTLCAEGASQNMETFDCLNTWTQCGQVRMVIKGSYKLQTDMEGSCYLYDLAQDPLEMDNLWGKPGMEAVQVDMLQEMAAAILRAQDPLPPPHRRYRFKRHPKGYTNQPFTAADNGVEDLKKYPKYD